jgi:DNA-binding winged helix-turn-helix (wHTH) protein
MKIVLNTKNADLINFFSRKIKDISNKLENKESISISASRIESGIFDIIDDPKIFGYIIEAPSAYSKRALDSIKKKSPYIPVILFGPIDSISKISGADMYVPYISDSEPMEAFFSICLDMLISYNKKLEKLLKVTTKISEPIYFGNCKYDPTRRILFHKGEEIRKLSSKEGGIVETLGSNFAELVKKEILLEKVWRNSDYFSSRSMDVYITNLRKLFKKHNINISIKNISGAGLIME